MIILGIETSCDETAVSILEASGDLTSPSFKVLGSALHSQVATHKEFGGVVPRLAKREHLKNLPIVLGQALKNAGMTYGEQNPGIDMIAVTVGPGLEPALWTGITFAKMLGEKWQAPVHGTNHMEGHVASVLLNKTDEFSNKKIKFPAIALLISGGHTELVLLNSWTDKKKIGETKDDAVGEAFDKVARMLGLPYPGGPEISKLAEEARIQNLESGIKFPRPMIHSKDFDFSFSGLKTAVLYYVRELRSTSSNEPCERDGASTRKFSAENYPCEREDGISQLNKLKIAREFEDAATEVLIFKTKSAIMKYNPNTLIVGGGVIANKNIRENILKLKEHYSNLEIMIPEKELATDNATMIAIAGYLKEVSGQRGAELEANGNLELN